MPSPTPRYPMHKTLRHLTLVLVLLCPLLGWAGQALTPDEAVRAAFEASPELRAAEAVLLQAEGEMAQAFGANPTLSGSVLVDGPAELQLSRPVSLTGEGMRRRQAAAARVEAANAQLRRARFELAHAVRTAYVDAVVAIEVAEVADEGLALAVRLVDLVSRLEAEGEASELEVNLARLAQAEAGLRLMEASAFEAAAAERLSALVAMPVHAGMLARDIDVPAPSEGVEEDRSDVRAAQAVVLAAERELAAQQAAALPPLVVGVRAEIDGGVTTVGPSLAVELPLRNRNQAGRADARGELLTAQAHVVEAEAVASTEVATSRQRDELGQETVSALGLDPLAAAAAALESVEAGYVAGEIDLIQVVLLQAQILGGQAAVVQLEGFVARARLDLLLAVEDPALVASQ